MRALPDVNAAESARRLPGVALQTEVGEGRYLNIRGIDADLNNTTFGGIRLSPSNNASPFGGGRAVALDAIPAGLIDAITVTKTGLPEMDAEALGGTIELVPRSMPKHRNSFVEARIGTGRESLRGTGIVDLALTTGMRFGAAAPLDELSNGTGRPLSLVLGIAGYRDRRGVDDTEPAYLDDGVHPPLSYASWDERYYQYVRRRYGVSAELRYQERPDALFYLRALRTGYSESLSRNRLVVTPDGNPTVHGNQLVDGISANGFDKSLTESREQVSNTVFAIGGTQRLGSALIDVQAGYTRGRFDKPEETTATFTSKPVNTSVAYNNSGSGNIPRFEVVPGGDYLDPAAYTLSGFENQRSQIDDHASSIALNLQQALHWTGAEEESLKIGASARWRRRSVTVQPVSYSNLPQLGLEQFVHGGPQTIFGGAQRLGAPVDTAVLPNLLAPLAGISVDDAINAALQSQRDQERIAALYAQYHGRFGALDLIGGLRLEQTRRVTGAFAQGIDAAGDAFITPIDATQHYSNFFPSLQGRFQLDPTRLVRVALGSSIGRPGFNQTSASLAVNPALNLVTRGNPALQPTTSINLDLAFEQYLPESGIASVTLFDKEIRNAIGNDVQQVVLPASGLFAGINGSTRVVSYSNVGHAHARGIELAYQSRFRNLPGAWSGFGLDANYTVVDSRFAIRPGETASLPSAARHTINLALTYQRGPLEARLAAYRVTPHLIAIGAAPGLDTFSDPGTTVDLGMRYAINATATLYLNGKNLSNSPLKFYEGSAERTTQRELYGRTVQAGVSLAY